LIDLSGDCSTSAGVIYWGGHESGKRMEESAGVVVSHVGRAAGQVERAISTVETVVSPLVMISDSLNSSIRDACGKMNETANDLQTRFLERKSMFDNNLANMYNPIDRSTSLCLSIPIYSPSFLKSCNASPLTKRALSARVSVSQEDTVGMRRDDDTDNRAHRHQYVL
jgi:hypothetical protein